MAQGKPQFSLSHLFRGMIHFHSPPYGELSMDHTSTITLVLITSQVLTDEKLTEVQYLIDEDKNKPSWAPRQSGRHNEADLTKTSFNAATKKLNLNPYCLLKVPRNHRRVNRLERLQFCQWAIEQEDEIWTRVIISDEKFFS